MTITISRVGATKDLLGESPFWDSGTLYWTDAVAGIVRGRDLVSGVVREWRLPAPIGSIAPALGDAMIVALKEEVVLLDLASGSTSRIGATGIAHPNVRLNDGKVDRAGNFICGTMHSSRPAEEPLCGGLYRVGADLSLRRVADALGIANGPCFSPDGETMYVSDSAARKLWAYRYDPSSGPGSRRLLADTAGLGSGVDGATVDSQGRIWGVLVRAGKIACFTPEGRVDSLVDVPLTHPTSLCFGGAALDSLFVTSLSRSHHLSAPEEQAGGLFVIEGLNATGIAVDRFAAGVGV